MAIPKACTVLKLLGSKANVTYIKLQTASDQSQHKMVMQRTRVTSNMYLLKSQMY